MASDVLSLQGMSTSDERFLRRLINQLDDETLVHQASRQLGFEAEAQRLRRRVEVARAARDKSAARVSRLLSRVEAAARRARARDADLVARRERWQALGPSVVRISFRVGLVISLTALMLARASLVVLVPLLALWFALLARDDR